VKDQERRYQATGKREFKTSPWHKAGPLIHLGDNVEPDQLVVNNENTLSLCVTDMLVLFEVSLLLPKC
jgi:hypothetical protein